jgi:hypothetical protein
VQADTAGESFLLPLQDGFGNQHAADSAVLRLWSEIWAVPWCRREQINVDHMLIELRRYAASAEHVREH